MSIIWISAGVVAALGLLMGLALGVAGRFFSVESDERIDKVRELLPGANCGACGFFPAVTDWPPPSCWRGRRSMRAPSTRRPTTRKSRF